MFRRNRCGFRIQIYLNFRGLIPPCRIKKMNDTIPPAPLPCAVLSFFTRSFSNHWSLLFGHNVHPHHQFLPGDAVL